MSAPDPVTRADYQMLADFRHALRKFLHFSEAAAKRVGLPPQQHQALLAIRGSAGPDPMTIGELAERLQIKHHSAVGLVDRLVAEGYVRRITGGRDRREVRLALTPRSATVLARLSAIHKDELRRIGPEINRLLRALNDGE
jgi:DNA-binding MarR family transcriptional regulator